MKQIFTLLLILSSFYTYAQKTGSVSGRIIQSTDKKPIDYASLALKNLADSSTVGAANTTEDGKFVFKNLNKNSIGIELENKGHQYGYQDFPKGTDEANALNNLLEENSKNGWQFIADADARAASGFHPYAHLWDNNADAMAGLEQTIAVRKKALEQFNENAIPNGTPLSKLEDVLVPLYNYHRYQYEAVTKLVGGMPKESNCCVKEARASSVGYSS